MAKKQKGFTTRVLLAGRDVAIAEHPVAAPLYQTATFSFDDVEAFSSVAQTKTSGGYLYSRWANPTTDRLARMIATMEGAEATACFASGMAAIHGALTALTTSGDHMVAATQLYGGTHGLLERVMPRQGVSSTLVDGTDLAAVEAACTDRTTVIYAETIGNPALPVADIAGLAAIAQRRGARLIMDATFTPPSMLRPLDYGVDISIHSATKYLGGHSDVTVGVVSGRAVDIEAMRQLSIEVGGICAPFEAWLCARGVETLALRTVAISSNALELATALEETVGVTRVLYPGLKSHPHHDLARELLGEMFGGMLTFDVGSLEAGRSFLERISIAQRAASLGGTKTLAVHPASVTHTQLSPEQRVTAGITEGMIRVAVGIEDVSDLIDDFRGALA